VCVLQCTKGVVKEWEMEWKITEMLFQDKQWCSSSNMSHLAKSQ